jgi:carbonic anhydrase
VVKVRNNAPTNDTRGFADRVVWANVFEAMASLESSEPVLRQLVTRQQLKLKGAVYHLETGKAEFLR